MNKNIHKTQKTQKTKQTQKTQKTQKSEYTLNLWKTAHKIKDQNTSQPPGKSAKVSRKLQSKKCHFTRKKIRHSKSKKMGPKCLYGLQIKSYDQFKFFSKNSLTEKTY